MTATADKPVTGASLGTTRRAAAKVIARLRALGVIELAHVAGSARRSPHHRGSTVIPIDFKGSNALLTPPDGASDSIEPCAALIMPYGDNGKCVITRWQMTAEELAEFEKTKTVWLIVVSPRDHAPNPVTLTAISPFRLAAEAAEDGT